MIKQFIGVLRWLLRLGLTFAKVVPFQTLNVVVATLVAQVTMLLATLLPLKIIILLGSDGIPRYFPPSFAQYERDQLIIWLSIATGVFYVAHLLAEKLISLCSASGSRKLVNRTRKVALFEDQDELASNGYRTYARALAGGVFAVLVVALLSWVYRDVAYVIMGYMLASALVLSCIYQFNRRLQSRFMDFLPGAVSVLSTFGFLVVFAFILTQFMLGYSVPLLMAIISMMLSRQMFSRLSTIVSSTGFLLGNRLKLNSLFFHSQVYVEREHPQQEDFFTLFVPGQREEWLKRLFSQVVPGVEGIPVFEWRQTGMPGVVAFRVTVESDSSSYMLRFYAPIRKPWAINEATLLSERVMDRLPAPRLLACLPFENIHVNVFELPVVQPVTGREHAQCVGALNDELMAMAVPGPLVTRYCRSKSMLRSRMERDWIKRVRFAANTEEDHRLISELDESWERIGQVIEHLPVMLVNPQAGADNVVVDKNGRPLLLGWGAVGNRADWLPLEN